MTVADDDLATRPRARRAAANAAYRMRHAWPPRQRQTRRSPPLGRSTDGTPIAGSTPSHRLECGCARGNWRHREFEPACEHGRSRFRLSALPTARCVFPTAACRSPSRDTPSMKYRRPSRGAGCGAARRLRECHPVPTTVATPGMPNPEEALRAEHAARRRRDGRARPDDAEVCRRPIGPVIPEDLQRIVSFKWNGPLDQAVAKLAQTIGYTFYTTAPPARSRSKSPIADYLGARLSGFQGARRGGRHPGDRTGRSAPPPGPGDPPCLASARSSRWRAGRRYFAVPRRACRVESSGSRRQRLHVSPPRAAGPHAGSGRAERARSRQSAEQADHRRITRIRSSSARSRRPLWRRCRRPGPAIEKGDGLEPGRADMVRTAALTYGAQGGLAGR